MLLLGSSGLMLIPLLQTIKDLEALGYAHVLPIAKDALTCDAIAKHIPGVGCAFSSFKLGLSSDVTMVSGQQPAKVDLFHVKWVPCMASPHHPACGIASCRTCMAAPPCMGTWADRHAEMQPWGPGSSLPSLLSLFPVVKADAM